MGILILKNIRSASAGQNKGQNKQRVRGRQKAKPVQRLMNVLKLTVPKYIKDLEKQGYPREVLEKIHMKYFNK